MNDTRDTLPGGEMHEALLETLEREVWPRTLAELGVSRTISFNELADTVDREVLQIEPFSKRIGVELFRAAEQVCETNSCESKETLAEVVLEARAFLEWVKTKNITSMSVALADVKAKKEDPLDTKLMLRGPRSDVEMNLSKDPATEQMVEASISAIESATGQPVNLDAVLIWYKDAATYLEKRMARGDFRRLRIVDKEEL